MFHNSANLLFNHYKLDIQFLVRNRLVADFFLYIQTDNTRYEYWMKFYYSKEPIHSPLFQIKYMSVCKSTLFAARDNTHMSPFCPWHCMISFDISIFYLAAAPANKLRPYLSDKWYWAQTDRWCVLVCIVVYCAGYQCHCMLLSLAWDWAS